MVLYDDDHACMLCDEQFETRQEWAYHLAAAHQVRDPQLGYQAAQMPQASIPHNTYNGNTSVLSSPFRPTSRQSFAYSTPIPATYAHSSPGPRTAAATHLLTPPDSLSTASPLPHHSTPAQRPTQGLATPLQRHSRPVQRPAQQHASPLPPQGSLSQTTAQEYAAQLPALHTTSFQALAQGWQAPTSLPDPRLTQPSAHGYASPHSPIGIPTRYLPQQPGGHPVSGAPLAQQMLDTYTSALSEYAQPLQSAQGSTSIPAAVTPAFCLPASIPFAKLRSAIPRFPQEIYDLGLTDADFDPTAHNGEYRCVQSQYVDIPPSMGLPDELLFNGSCRRMLCYGNLLRLASRYSDHELISKINAGRSDYLFDQTTITRRLKAAIKWAADRPEWQEVGDIQAWLDRSRSAKLLERNAPANKRKREDDDDGPHQVRATPPQQGVSRTQHRLRATPSSPPPAKRVKATGPPTPQPRAVDLAGHDGLDGKHKDNPISALPGIDITHIGDAPSIYVQPSPERKSPSTSPDLGIFGQPAARTRPNSTNAHTSLIPPTNVAQSTTHSFSVADLTDLTEVCGSDNAMALINALGMSGEQASIAQNESPSATSININVGINYDRIFQELLEQPQNFLSKFELRVGEYLAHWGQLLAQKQQEKMKMKK